MSIGIFAGFSSGLLGVGGGLIVVPSLLLAFHYFEISSPYLMQMAIGTSLGAMVFTSASSAISHYLKKGVNWPFAFALAPGILIGSILGATIADSISSQQLKSIFGVCCGLIGLYFLFTAKRIEKKLHVQKIYYPLFVLIGTIVGTISTLLGIGGGIMNVPILTAFRLPLKNAISTSAVMGCIIAITGAISFFYLGLKHHTDVNVGYIYWPAFITVGLSASLAAPFGAKMAYQLSTQFLKRIFGFLLLLISSSFFFS